MIQDVAKRYLAGEGMSKLAREYGINHSFLHKTIMESCGDSYTITWDIPDLNIKETVPIKVPRLLPEKVITALHDRADANRTYLHGNPKHPYLLKGMVFCETCGYGFFGQPPNKANAHQYYRHAHTPRAKECDLSPRPWVKCRELEDAVLRHLFDTFGNPKAVQQAVEEATPNADKVGALLERRKQIEDLLEKCQRGKDRVIQCIADDTITKEEAVKQIQKQRDREAPLKEELQQINASLENIPSAETIASAAERVMQHVKGLRYSSARTVAKKRLADSCFDLMTYEDKRHLLEMVFSGKAPDGRPAGVYVSPDPDYTTRRRKVWRLTLRGVLLTDGGKGNDSLVMQYGSDSPAPAPPAPCCAARRPRHPA